MITDQIQEYIARFEAVSFTVSRRLNSLIREVIDEDLTLDQFLTLRYIFNRENCTAGELAEKFCVNRSATTAITSRLADKNYIQRMQDEKDRRVVSFSLTKQGKKIYEAAAERINRVLAGFIEQFSQEEIDQFLRTYEKLAVIVEREGEIRV